MGIDVLEKIDVAEDGYLSLNEIAAVIKEVFDGIFVFRTSKPEADSVSLRAAIRQDEEFMALFTRVLWDEFIPGGARTSSSKLSTLFNRNLTYVNRHGLVGAKRAFHELLTPELFKLEERHIAEELIHLGARRAAHGSDFFYESKLSADENRALDFTAAKNSLRLRLAKGVYSLIEAAESGGVHTEVIEAMRLADFFEDGSVRDGMIEPALSVLLLLSLNLYDSSSSEYADIMRRAKCYIRSLTPSRDASVSSSALSFAEVASAILELSHKSREALAKSDSLTGCELMGMLEAILSDAKLK